MATEAQEHAHPTAGVYVRVGLILFVLTALEVGLYEIVHRQAPPGLATIFSPIFIPVLLALSALKFALVAMFYMHLKQDSRLFSGVFVFPLIIAIVVVSALIILFAYIHLLHPLGPLPKEW